jgi:hypothetical protein
VGRARFPTPVQADTGTHSDSYTVGTGSLLGVKLAGVRGVGFDHPPPSSAEVKVRVELTSSPSLHLRGLLF